MQTYRAKSGKEQFKPSLEEIENALEDQEGFCVGCGTNHSGIEPDARKYRCSACGADKVYGAEELVLMGLYHE